MIPTSALLESDAHEEVDTEVEPLADAFGNVAGRGVAKDLREQD